MAVAGDPSAVAVHNAVNRGETETGPLAYLLGGEKGLEDVGDVLLLQPRSGVPDLDPDKTPPRRGRGAHRDPAPALHGVGRVEDDVHENLIELLDVGRNKGQLGVQVHVELHILEKGLVDQKKLGPKQGLVDVLEAGLPGGLAGEGEQLVDDIPAALPVGEDPLHVRAQLLLQLVFLQDKLGKKDYAPQGVVYLVGHPGGQLADGAHLLGLEELDPGPVQFLGHPPLLPQVVKKAHRGRLPASFVDDGRGKADGNGGAVLVDQLGLVGLQLSGPAEVPAAEQGHDLPGPVAVVDVPDGDQVIGLLLAVARDCAGGPVEDDDPAGHVRGDDGVGRTHDQVFEEGVGPLQLPIGPAVFLLDLFTLGYVPLEVDQLGDLPGAVGNRQGPAFDEVLVLPAQVVLVFVNGRFAGGKGLEDRTGPSRHGAGGLPAADNVVAVAADDRLPLQAVLGQEQVVAVHYPAVLCIHHIDRVDEAVDHCFVKPALPPEALGFGAFKGQLRLQFADSGLETADSI